MFLYAYLALEYLLDLPTKGHLLYEIQQEILPDELRDLLVNAIYLQSNILTR